jgi:hypothetical protein
MDESVFCLIELLYVSATWTIVRWYVNRKIKVFLLKIRIKWIHFYSADFNKSLH